MPYSYSVLTGGPLGSKRYCLNHIEVHWGSVDSRGSEHTVNGIGYSAEVRKISTSICLAYEKWLSDIIVFLVGSPVWKYDYLKVIINSLLQIIHITIFAYLPVQLANIFLNYDTRVVLFQIQLVHWNHHECEDFAQALSSEDGIAILSVLVKVSICYCLLVNQGATARQLNISARLNNLLYTAEQCK